MHAERLFSILLLIASLSLAGLAFTFNSKISYDPIGAKAFPLLIFSLLSISFFILSIRKGNYFEQLNLNQETLKKSVLVLLAFFAYAYLFEIASYPLSSMLMIFIVAKAFNGRTVPSLITAVAMSLGSYLLFDLLLDVPLPLGPFS